MSFRWVAQSAAWHSKNEVVHVEPHWTTVDLADCVGTGELLVAPDVGAAHGVLHTLVHCLRHDVVREPNGPQHVIHDPLLSEQGDLGDSLAGLVAIGLLGNRVTEDSCFPMVRFVQAASQVILMKCCLSDHRLVGFSS